MNSLHYVIILDRLYVVRNLGPTTVPGYTKVMALFCQIGIMADGTPNWHFPTIETAKVPDWMLSPVNSADAEKFKKMFFGM